MEELTTSTKWGKRPLVVKVDKDGLSIGPLGLRPQTVKWEDVLEFVLGKAEKDTLPWQAIGKATYMLKVGVKKLDPVEERMEKELVEEAILSLRAAMYRG